MHISYRAIANCQHLSLQVMMTGRDLTNWNDMITVRGMVGERLWRLRERLGISRGDLARAVGLDETTVWRLERGERRGSIEVVVRLARFLAEALGEDFKEVLAYLLGEPSRVEGWREPVGPVRYLTVKEAARFLGIPIWQVKQAVRSGLMRSRSRPGPRGAIMISIQEVERYAREVLDRDEHEVVYG